MAPRKRNTRSANTRRRKTKKNKQKGGIHYEDRAETKDVAQLGDRFISKSIKLEADNIAEQMATLKLKHLSLSKEHADLSPQRAAMVKITDNQNSGIITPQQANIERYKLQNKVWPRPTQREMEIESQIAEGNSEIKNLRVKEAAIFEKMIIPNVVNGVKGVSADMFMSVYKELMKIARDDLFTNKENPEIFRRIIAYGMKATGHGGAPETRWRGCWVYGKCLQCEHVNCTDHWLPPFQINAQNEPTNIPHNYASVLKYSICQAKGRGLIGRVDSGYIPCWFNE